MLLSAGSYMSPPILMRSGIGDGAQLQSHGIAPLHHLPSVGSISRTISPVAVEMRTENTESYGISLKAFPRGVKNVAEYLLARKGPIAGNVFEGVGFFRTDPTLERPDIQFVFMPAVRNMSGGWLPMGHGYCINSVVLHPKSRGSVTLASADPHASPLIDPNYLSEPEDYAPLVRALKLARRILAAPAFDRLKAHELFPGPAVADDEELRSYIRRTAGSVHHPVSTCRMGVDAESVVDPQLRLRGIERLRVVDASVFPTLIGGNTNATVVMIAEKAADMILGKPAPKPVVLPEEASHAVAG